MKKLFLLVSEKQKTERLVEQMKSDVKKYLKRERGKQLPDEDHHWEFHCRIGGSEEDSTKVDERDLKRAIDGLVEKGQTQIYLEILKQPVKGERR